MFCFVKFKCLFVFNTFVFIIHLNQTNGVCSSNSLVTFVNVSLKEMGTLIVKYILVFMKNKLEYNLVFMFTNQKVCQTGNNELLK